jgi:hypothetical protein
MSANRYRIPLLKLIGEDPRPRKRACGGKRSLAKDKRELEEDKKKMEKNIATTAKRLQVHSRSVNAVALSLMTSASGDKTCRLWDAA